MARLVATHWTADNATRWLDLAARLDRGRARARRAHVVMAGCLVAFMSILAILSGDPVLLLGPVRGDATGGSTGHVLLCCFLGDHQVQPPTTAALGAMGGLLAWLAERHAIDLDAGPTIQFTSEGSNRWPAGSLITTDPIVGHLDLSQTACPGDAAYPLVRGALLDIARAFDPPAATTVPPTSPTSRSAGSTTPMASTTVPATPPPSAPTTTTAAPARPGGADDRSEPPVAALAATTGALAVIGAGGWALRRRSRRTEGPRFEDRRDDPPPS